MTKEYKDMFEFLQDMRRGIENDPEYELLKPYADSIERGVVAKMVEDELGDSE